MELFDLSGQVAIVTGSSQGIGRAIAERMAEHGARVVFSSRTLAACQPRAGAVNERYGEERAIAVACDAMQRPQLAHMVERTMEQWGRIDCVVGNALVEGSQQAWIEKLDVEHYTDWFEGNVTNNAYLVQLVSPIMRAQGGGSIIFVSSTSGIAALEDYLGYGPSKAALSHLARILAVQLGPHNIRVNAIAPGIIASRGWDPEGEWSDAEEREIGTGQTPLGRPGTPDEIASCAVWLASPGGTYATGGVFVVDGGQTLKGMTGPHDVRTARRDRQRGGA
ncbi:MAG TPA: SDR family oxidoreductase [Acidimicrobiia bacterium]|nr:SDR family oxidoreductase [Acidimicrobiia bacterium]